MENLFFFLATSLAFRLSTTRQCKQRLIGNTGCSALLYAQPHELNPVKTASGDDLYFYEYRNKAVTYGIILINGTEDRDLLIATEMLSHYIDKLQTPLFVKHSIGASRETDYYGTEQSILHDFWQDDEGQDWQVKGYTNGQQMAVLYVKNIAEADSDSIDEYLDSFHFLEG